MGRSAVEFTGPRMVAVVEEAAQPLRADEVRVQTFYSGISAGTELTTYRNTNPYLHKRWDPAARLFVPDAANESVQYPVVVGYEEVGAVSETGPGVDDLPVGTVVYGTWGHRAEAVVEASQVRERTLPAGADPLLGIFSHIGATALNGILDSSLRLGETVAVFGLGVVGQLVCQLARLSGAEVIGVDLIPMRLQMAEQLGTKPVLDGRAGSPAEAIKRLTGGRGADVCIEASGATQALNEAIRACARDARVVTLGFFEGAAQGLYLGEEFHHNRIQIICSQIGGVAPRLQPRWDRLRLVQTVMRLAAEGRLHLRPLITHIVPAAEAPALFRQLDEAPADVLQVVLDFRSAPLAGRPASQGAE